MFNVTFAAAETFLATFEDEEFLADFGETILVPVGDIYEGSYEFTPTQEQQTIQIEGLIAAHDITVNPIPSNYGKITWNGSILTVS